MSELNDILQRLEPELGPLSGEPQPLRGGITNRNYRAALGGEQFVVRLHGARTQLLGIDREAERRASDAAAKLGIAPPVAASLPGCLVTRYVPCRALAPADVAARAEEIAQALRAFHDSGVQLGHRFWVPELLEDYERHLRARGVEPGEDFAQAVAVARRIAHAIPLRDPRPCHNDLLAGNIICEPDAGRLLLVDWEYAGMGHRLFDLGNVAVNNEFDADAEQRLLSAYLGRPPDAGTRAGLKLMRVLSDVREAAWGALQTRISTLDFDFFAYARAHFERLHAAVAEPDFEEWLAAAPG
ncbi:MAG TPA: phosphotransferase [Solirubrobacteraceae bacterium]|nr:phosphotransferase [Solirubrobacteraceae bacterium]